MIISNSSPLIHLTKLGKIKNLIEMTDQILVPKAVYEETVVKGKANNYSEAFIIENLILEDQIKIVDLKRFNESKYPPLGRGELESLELAKQNNCSLITDDNKARNIAEILQINYQTTIATIFELLLSKTINFREYITNIKKYSSHSWISADIIQEYIEKGEKYGR